MIYYPRTLESKIKEKLHSPEAIFILGARQVGKTTLMKHLMNELPENQYIYLDLENPTFLSILNKGVNEFLAYLKYQGLSNETRNCIFIDEIQYAPDFSSIIKYMVDHYSENYKLILSGSSSLQIRKQFKDSLVGRKIIFELYPLSFEEYCCFKEENKISELLQKINPFELKEDPLRFEKEKVHYLLREYLIYGGFPKVALQENKKDKIQILQDIVQSYVLKDIRSIFRLEKIAQFNHLVKLLAAIMGKELNISQLATETRLNKQTLENYLNVLEAGYIIKLIYPFHKNLSSEFRKTPKCYYLDIGLRNFLISDFNEPEFRSDRGELLENFIFTQLIKKSNAMTKINYWRTKSRQEIDFILQKESKLYAIEVKWSKVTTYSLRRFKKIYPEADIYTISMMQDFSEEERILPTYLV